jgi:hypothetical protein
LGVLFLVLLQRQSEFWLEFLITPKAHTKALVVPGKTAIVDDDDDNDGGGDDGCTARIEKRIDKASRTRNARIEAVGRPAALPATFLFKKWLLFPPCPPRPNHLRWAGVLARVDFC